MSFFFCLTKLEYGSYLNVVHATLNTLFLYATFLIIDSTYLSMLHSLLHYLMVKIHRAIVDILFV